MCRSAARVQNEPVPGMRGCAGGEGRFAVPHCCRGTDPPPPAEQLSGAPGKWEGKAGAGRVKGCLGEAGGTKQKKALFRVASLIREGSDRLERGCRFGAKKKARSAIRLQASACGRSGPFRSQTVWYHKKGRGRVWGNHRFLPHMERSGSPRRSGRHLAMPNALASKEKGTFRCPFLLVRKMGLEPTHRSTGF